MSASYAFHSDVPSRPKHGVFGVAREVDKSLRPSRCAGGHQRPKLTQFQLDRRTAQFFDLELIGER
jgi:hypothetical protein